MQEQPKEQWEMPADEIAGQAGRAATATGPYGEGRLAARDGKPKSANPFQKGNGQRKPWSDGWNAETSDMATEAALVASAADKAPGGATEASQEGEGSEGWQIREATPEEAAKLEAATPKVHRINKDGVVGIQQPLDIPGDQNTPSARQQEAGAAYAESILVRVSASDHETKCRKACEQIMLEEGVEVMSLPNGGKLIKEVVNETTFHYESPKKKKISRVEAEGGEE